jgi:membrane protease YdiL (CAAX protease family)
MVSVKYPLNNDYVPNFFVSLTIQLILSIIAIVAMKKYLTCPIALPAANTLLKPIIAALAATIVINGLMTFATKMAGDKIEVPEALLKLKPIQVFIFVFIYAPIAEELLYRGFLMNLLKPLQQKNILIFKRAISLPVMVSAIAFGAAHLILITTGVSALFLIRIILFTTSLGILAGYYQEKHNNHVYAIIVHMTGNSLAVIASLAN